MTNLHLSWIGLVSLNSKTQLLPCSSFPEYIIVLYLSLVIQFQIPVKLIILHCRQCWHRSFFHKHLHDFELWWLHGRKGICLACSWLGLIISLSHMVSQVHQEWSLSIDLEVNLKDYLVWTINKNNNKVFSVKIVQKKN